LEIIFTLPEKAETIRREIEPADFTNAHLQELLRVCFEMHSQGVLPAYDRVTARLEDADLKTLAAEIDLDARERSVSNELVEHTLGYFRRRRELRERAPEALAGPHASPAPDALDQAAREKLRQATELHRKRVSRTTLK
jgi:hypothetical protein